VLVDVPDVDDLVVDVIEVVAVVVELVVVVVVAVVVVEVVAVAVLVVVGTRVVVVVQKPSCSQHHAFFAGDHPSSQLERPDLQSYGRNERVFVEVVV
jgi:hypothetical protein